MTAAYTFVHTLNVIPSHQGTAGRSGNETAESDHGQNDES